MKKLIGLSMMFLAVLSAAFAAQPSTTSGRPQQIRNFSDLLALLKKHKPASNVYIYSTARLASDAGISSASLFSAVATSAASGSSDSPSFSTTNVQVAGVDEGDILKTDGEYIYQINQERILILRAAPVSLASVQNVIKFDTKFYPREVYLDGNRLVVIGACWRALGQQWGTLTGSTVKVLVYDVSNKAKVKQEREVEFDADYLSSRRIGDSLYVIGRKYPDYYTIMRGKPTTTALVPQVRTNKGRFTPIGIRNIFYFPDVQEPDYVVVAGLNLAEPKSAVNVQAYLGAGDKVYASRENLFVAASQRPLPVLIARPLVLTADDSASTNVVTDPSTSKEKTTIYKFALADASSTFVARGEVRGTILNQYSMDEHNGYFRAATTLHGSWWNSTNDVNSLSILDANMQLTGQLTDLARGERIYAARFMGDRCYLVTYKNIDPLFVIDLSNPQQPSVLGQLEMPGFSNYLHPYDATHIIGIGKTTTVITNGSWQTELTQGVKLALYDVTDVNHPIEMFSASIGDRGTDSAALYDPKAFLFDRDRNLFALPITVAQINPESPWADTPWAWGTAVFQGAYVYNVTLDGGFVLKGSITHIPAGRNIWDNWPNFITRILRIEENIYTLSDARMKINALDTLAEVKSVDLPMQEVPISRRTIQSTSSGTLTINTSTANIGGGTLAGGTLMLTPSATATYSNISTFSAGYYSLSGGNLFSSVSGGSLGLLGYSTNNGQQTTGTQSVGNTSGATLTMVNGTQTNIGHIEFGGTLLLGDGGTTSGLIATNWLTGSVYSGVVSTITNGVATSNSSGGIQLPPISGTNVVRFSTNGSAGPLVVGGFTGVLGDIKPTLPVIGVTKIDPILVVPGASGPGEIRIQPPNQIPNIINLVALNGSNSSAGSILVTSNGSLSGGCLLANTSGWSFVSNTNTGFQTGGSEMIIDANTNTSTGTTVIGAVGTGVTNFNGGSLILTGSGTYGGGFIGAPSLTNGFIVVTNSASQIGSTNNIAPSDSTSGTVTNIIISTNSITGGYPSGSITLTGGSVGFTYSAISAGSVLAPLTKIPGSQPTLSLGTPMPGGLRLATNSVTAVNVLPTTSGNSTLNLAGTSGVTQNFSITNNVLSVGGQSFTLPIVIYVQGDDLLIGTNTFRLQMEP